MEPIGTGGIPKRELQWSLEVHEVSPKKELHNGAQLVVDQSMGSSGFLLRDLM